MLEWLLCWLLLHCCNSFTFIYPSVSPSNLTINVLTTYTFLAMRNYDVALNPTPYATQLVPAGASIVITFPNQYSLTSPVVADLLINDASITGFNFTVNSTSITISNAVLSSAAIANVTITVNNILNPYPAITTNPFIVAIGSDISANSSSSAITLTAGSFSACSLSFSPSTVNTTGAMVVTVSPANKILVGGAVIVTFPPSLQWVQDISASHTLPIGSALTCSKLSGSVISGSCSGSVSTAEVTYLISAINGSIVSSAFSYSVSSLFSPPTTSPPDTLQIRSVSASGDTIDSCSTSITGLTAQTLALSLSPSSSPLLVNSLTSLILSFSLPDTISKSDYFQLLFPSNSTFAFSVVSSSNLSLFNSGVTYNASNLTLIMRQATTSSIKFAGTVCAITVSQYRAPTSTKTTDYFTLQVYTSSGALKMQGVANLTATAKKYITTVLPASYLINNNASYAFTVSTTDSMLSSAVIQLKFPAELSFAFAGNCIASNNFTSGAPTCLPNGTNTVLISNLSNATISPGTYTFAVQTLTNAPKALTTSNFTLTYYYSSDSEAQVGTSSISGVTLLPNEINGSSIAVQLTNSTVTASAVTMNISFKSEDAVGSGGHITITIASQVGISSGYTPQCMIYLGSQSSVPSCSLNGSTFKIPINSLTIAAGQTCTVTLIGFAILPKSTRPTGYFSIYTYSSDGYMIGYSNSSYRLSGLLTAAYFVLALTPANRTNSLTTDYALKMQQNSPWDASSFLMMQLPSTITANSVVCVDATNPNISCKLLSNSTANYVNISLPNSASSISLTISSLRNPSSFQPTAALAFATYTSDGYIYAADSSSITVSNSAPSVFPSLGYTFSSTTYNSSSSLILNITNLINSTTSYSLTSFSQFFNSSISNISCSSILDLTCDLNGSTLNIVTLASDALFPISLSISIDGLFVPLANLSAMTFLSYSKSFLVSQYNDITWQTSCILPCYTCNSSTPAACLSCYPTKIFTSLVYYYSNSCLAACPAGSIWLGGSLICSACDSNCAECSISVANCTQCVQNSTNNRLVIASRTCVAGCPSGSYSSNATNATKYTPVCNACISPCATCTSATNCLACANSSLFYHAGSCLTTCPANTTVANLSSMQCDPCSPSCATCVNATSTCLSCNVSVAPLFIAGSASCVSACPAPLVADSNLTVCVGCESPCLSCAGTKKNCTSCLSSTNTYLSGTTTGACVSSCQQFYFANDSSQKCQSCSSVPGLNCQNCYNSTYCLSCDSSFVLFTANRSCLSAVPSGYLNLSGIAVACTNNCKECALAANNCTACADNYSLYVWLAAGSCLLACPNTTISISNVCVNCTSPCLTCSALGSNCTSCLTGYLYASGGGNRCLAVCPGGSFSSPTSSACQNCSSPCQNCLSSTICTTCAIGYLYDQSCLATCPATTTANALLMSCEGCATPCLTCENQTQNCTSCIAGYYYYQVIYRCYSGCPANVSLPGTGNLSFVCVSCTQPCATCSLTLANCTSCVSGLIYFNFSCVSSCPGGYLARAGVCQLCSNNCATCVDQSSFCLSCSGVYRFYLNTCIKSCPVAYSIVLNNACTACSNACLNCSADDVCQECPPSYVLIDGKCSTTCRSPNVMFYNETINKFVCADPSNPQVTLKSSLQLSSILPLPFTIISSFFFLCCLMSKLQNTHTYITGVGYSLYGCAQAAAIAYLLYVYLRLYSSSGDYSSLRLLMVVCLGIIAGLNLVSLLLITPCLKGDLQFKNWLQGRKRGSPAKQDQGQLSQEMQTLGSEHYQNESVECCSHKCSFALFTLFSFLISFKLRLFIFTKLFRFRCLSAQLQDVHGFRVFNLMSVFGIAYEGLACYICYKMFNLYTFGNDQQLMMALVDALAMVIVSFVLALLTTHKDQDFFKVREESKGGVDLGRRKKDKDPRNYKIDTKRLAAMNSRDQLVDINDSHSNLAEQGDIIVNHNIDSKLLPKRVSSSWVERTTPRKRSRSPLGEGKNIFDVAEQEDTYNPIQSKVTMSAKDRAELFHTSFQPQNKNKLVANSYWVERQSKAVVQSEGKFKTSAANLREKAENYISANLAQQEWGRSQLGLHKNGEFLQQSRIKSKQAEMLIKSSTCRPVNLADLQYFGYQGQKITKRQAQLPRGTRKEVIKEVDSESIASQRQKQPALTIVPQKGHNHSNDNKVIDFSGVDEMNDSIEQGVVIESKQKSFESVLPFVHQDGILKQKATKNNKKIDHQTKMPVNNKVDVGIDAKVATSDDKQRLLSQRQKKQFEQLLDVSIVRQKIGINVASQKDIGKKGTQQKMSLATGQIHQTFQPQLKEPKKINAEHQQNTKSLSLFAAQYSKKVEPIEPKKTEIKQLQHSQKNRKNIYLKSVQAINQIVEPQKQAKNRTEVVHAPKVYSRNKLASGQQLAQIEQLEQFDLKLNKKEQQLQRIRQELNKHNNLPLPKQKAESARRKKTEKNDIGSLVSQARKTKQNWTPNALQVQDSLSASRAQPNEGQPQDQLENIEFNEPSQNIGNTISNRLLQQAERDQAKGNWLQEKSSLQNRNIFDKQLYSQSEALPDEDLNERTFKKKSQNFEALSQAEYHQKASIKLIEKSRQQGSWTQRPELASSQSNHQPQSSGHGEQEQEGQEGQVQEGSRQHLAKEAIKNGQSGQKYFQKQEQANEQQLSQQQESIQEPSRSHGSQQQKQGSQQGQQSSSRSHQYSEHEHQSGIKGTHANMSQEQALQENTERNDKQQSDNQDRTNNNQAEQVYQPQSQKIVNEKKDHFHAIKLNEIYQQSQSQASIQIQPNQNKQKSVRSKAPFIVESVPANISEASGNNDFTVQRIDKNYEQSNEESNDYADKTEIQLRKTYKRQGKIKQQENQGDYKSPFVFDQNLQTKPKSQAVDYDHGIYEKGRNRNSLSKDKPEVKDQKAKSNEEVIRLLSSVNKGSRNRKMLPKEERDERILIKMSRDQVSASRNVENTNLARKSTQKKNPLSMFKYEKRNEEYSQDQDVSQIKRQINLPKISTAQNFTTKKVEQPYLAVQQKSATAFDLYQQQSAFANNTASKVRKINVQVRQFNFGDEISSQVSNTNFNSEAELVKWKQNFVSDKTKLHAGLNYDTNTPPDRPLVNKLTHFGEQADQLQEIAEKPKKHRRKRSKDKKRKSPSRNKNSQLQRIYGL